MKTLELIRAARNHKCEISYMPEIDLNHYCSLIGIRKPRQWCWHWFNLFDTGHAYFYETYSMNTGKSHRGWKHGYKLTRSLGL